jgi:hypothetical protein
MVGAQRHAGRALLVAAGGDDHGRPQGLAQLDGRHADAAAAALHQQGLARLQTPAVEHVDQTVKKVSGRLAASSLRPAGTGRHWASGTTHSSA